MYIRFNHHRIKGPQRLQVELRVALFSQFLKIHAQTQGPDSPTYNRKAFTRGHLRLRLPAMAKRDSLAMVMSLVGVTIVNQFVLLVDRGLWYCNCTNRQVPYIFFRLLWPITYHVNKTQCNKVILY